MTPTLRKRHRQIWTVLALLLPLGFVAAWMSLPQPPPSQTLPPWMPDRIPGAVLQSEGGSADTTIFIQLWKGKEGQLQLEVQSSMMGDWETPAIWVYPASTADSSFSIEGDALGKLSLLGDSYRFSISRFMIDDGQRLEGVFLYDSLHQQVLTQAFFQR